MRILKYRLDRTDRQVLSIPENSLFVDAQMREGELCLWAIVGDDEKSKYSAVIRVFGTGQQVSPEGDLMHIATVQDGIYVWHVFEEVVDEEMEREDFSGSN